MLAELTAFSVLKHLYLKCTAQSSSSAWRKALVQGYLPWLWDLEPSAVAHK